ncbi:DUF4494 domain-containing protein [Parabacteroides merdae]|jgi:hypothetical protein|uniref:DUF4494 domain-containing protein n=1 Tax=Parabacteroides merdae TaxID=46503 RepID=UPI0034A31583
MEYSYSHVNNGSFLECKVTYDRVADDGMLKKVTEPYIVKAVSFTDAETTIIDYIAPFTSGDFLVKGIKRCKFTEIIMDKSGSRYYKCSLDYITVNEKNGMEKRIASLILVQASSVEEVIANVKSFMKGSLAEYIITKIEETAIMDVCNETIK